MISDFRNQIADQDLISHLNKLVFKKNPQTHCGFDELIYFCSQNFVNYSLSRLITDARFQSFNIAPFFSDHLR